MRSKKLFVFLIVLLFIASFAGLIAFRAHEKALKQKVSAQEEKSIPVEAFRVSQTKMKIMINLTGTTSAYEDIAVFPRVSGGKVIKIYKEVGDLVKNGEVLAELDTEMIDAQLKQANASKASASAAIRQAEIQVSTLRKDYERIKKLYEEEVVPKQQLDQIEGQYLAAKAALEVAKRKLEEVEALIRQLELTRSYHQILAPASGIISERKIEVGEIVSVSHPIFKINSISRVKVKVSVPENYLHGIKPGMGAEILADAYPDRKFLGKIRLISPIVDPKTRTAEVEIEVDNKELLLKPGMFTRVKIDIGEKEVLFVPQQALKRFEGTGTYYVFIVDENRRARIKEITIGNRSEDKIEVIKGLSPNELVILTVTSGVKEGVLLDVKEVAIQ
ncbi:MAG: efflux RND transporter periplasmic adaptor subunit [Synergistetes bacterium]|nr:efflux RND transporter periplasmic adaptor subunit [Synergistota bacterium]MCX8127597.1 efflux RND transporter periplasmic adaptor subunit [Synergistota bacterium]MDW8191486.1 efflux RND transporter periplasmic adaptor subunit [Synergistota bacterium]